VTPDDLARLHAACFTTPRPWTAAELRHLLAENTTFLIETTNGFALGRAVADEAELLTLAVAPTARRQGFGRVLLEQFEQGAAARGAASAFLEVRSDNRPATRLYESTGYGLLGTRKGYYRAPDGTRSDACIYGKRLDSDKTG